MFVTQFLSQGAYFIQTDDSALSNVYGCTRCFYCYILIYAHHTFIWQYYKVILSYRVAVARTFWVHMHLLDFLCKLQCCIKYTCVLCMYSLHVLSIGLVHTIVNSYNSYRTINTWGDLAANIIMENIGIYVHNLVHKSF